MKPYKVIGIMSGTSLDGLDIAYCEFVKVDGTWQYSIKKAETTAYNKEWKDALKNAENLNALDFCKLHIEYGKYIGQQVKKFIHQHKVKADYISSHGHTIFHQPDKGLTLQIGSGACIAAETALTTISDFRTLDVALNGQGAPLVPIGDLLLFPSYTYCLNIGGIANISYSKSGKKIAFDICPANMVLNYIAGKACKEYDKDGNMAKKGKVHSPLLSHLNNLDYYTLTPPKSLGKEWVDSVFLPIIDQYNISLEDIQNTLVEHISLQISKVVKAPGIKKILITGGGAHNKYLISKIKQRIRHQLIPADDTLINYKEALIFAFMGLLRVRKEINCLSTVTGAKHDSISGIIHFI